MILLFIVEVTTIIGRNRRWLRDVAFSSFIWFGRQSGGPNGRQLGAPWLALPL
jgi:hypothetical protein